jgi:hypothetical protein
MMIVQRGQQVWEWLVGMGYLGIVGLRVVQDLGSMCEGVGVSWLFEIFQGVDEEEDLWIWRVWSLIEWIVLNGVVVVWTAVVEVLVWEELHGYDY